MTEKTNPEEKKLTILYVEDEKAVQKMGLIFLSNHLSGYNVVAVDNYKDAVQAIEEGPASVANLSQGDEFVPLSALGPVVAAVSDWNYPGADGRMFGGRDLLRYAHGKQLNMPFVFTPGKGRSVVQEVLNEYEIPLADEAIFPKPIWPSHWREIAELLKTELEAQRPKSQKPSIDPLDSKL